jgi:hypothetical protein
MNTATFTERAHKFLLEHIEKYKDDKVFTYPTKMVDTSLRISWDRMDEDKWKFEFNANWFDGFHDVHVTAQKRGERRRFSVWFELVDGEYKAV